MSPKRLSLRIRLRILFGIEFFLLILFLKRIEIAWAVLIATHTLYCTRFLHCPHCGETLYGVVHFCPKCGGEIDFDA